jgi:hypothetical protein
MDWYLDGGFWARWLLQRGLGALYLVAFVCALNQFPALLGERGLLPAPRFLAHVPFRASPSLFHLHYSDRALRALAWLGIVLSSAVVVGWVQAGPIWVSVLVWLVLWALYMSIVNVGQTFYSFGWETMLLEAGFFAAFLGPDHTAPAPVALLAMRWILFRSELGAGLIKLRHDTCWRDLTCLYYHYETQPMPNGLSWYFHHFPKRVHRAGVVFSHFVQVVVPFGLFMPQPIATCAGLLMIAHQLLLIISGNYAWLNWLTVVLAASTLGDSLVPLPAAGYSARPLAFELVQYALALLTLALSVKPALNLVSKHQAMNASYNSLHLVNAYGAFGSVTRERFEVVLEGRSDSTEQSWREYGLKGKPGDPRRRPPQVAPYHLRLDWLMWFVPLRGFGRPERWLTRLCELLLEGDRAALSLLGHNPFPEQPPQQIRALMYQYAFTTRSERAATGAIWKRELVSELFRLGAEAPKRAAVN